MRGVSEVLEGGGGTDILKSVDYALKMKADPNRLRIICYMTDGFVGNDMQILDYVRKNRGVRNTRETSLMKWHACDVALQSADDAIQVHGSYGFSNEYPVERFWRNARGAVIYEGTREVHTILQAEYALGYRQDKPLRCPQPPAVGYEVGAREPVLAAD